MWDGVIRHSSHRHSFLAQVYSTGLSNASLDTKAVLMWIWNAILYAVLICLIYFIALEPSFEYYGLYEMGSLIYWGMVMALQVKAIFMHCNWTRPNTIVMIISVGGLLLYCYVLSSLFTTFSSYEYDYYYIAQWLYGNGLFWFFGMFSVPIFCLLIDVIGQALLVILLPSREILFREVQYKVFVYS